MFRPWAHSVQKRRQTFDSDAGTLGLLGLLGSDTCPTPTQCWASVLLAGFLSSS
jgi:hypothetical protein